MEKAKEPMGASGMLGFIGTAGISLAKGFLPKLKHRFRSGAKEVAKDQAIGSGFDLFTN